MPKGIPLYSSDGELRDWITDERLKRLERLQMIRVVRHKKGHVARCILRARPGDPQPMTPGDYLGTRYSFREHLDNGRMAWSLKKLGHGDELRPIFLQVVSDCLVAP
jgi:hypothetical protein